MARRYYVTNKGENTRTVEVWGAFVELKPNVRTEIKNPYRAGKGSGHVDKVVGETIAQQTARMAKEGTDSEFAETLLKSYPHLSLVLEVELEDGSVSDTFEAPVPTQHGHLVNAAELPKIGEPEPPAPPPPPPAPEPVKVKTPPVAKPAPKPAAKPKGKGK